MEDGIYHLKRTLQVQHDALQVLQCTTTHAVIHGACAQTSHAPRSSHVSGQHPSILPGNQQTHRDPRDGATHPDMTQTICKSQEVRILQQGNRLTWG